MWNHHAPALLEVSALPRPTLRRLRRGSGMSFYLFETRQELIEIITSFSGFVLLAQELQASRIATGTASHLRGRGRLARRHVSRLVLSSQMLNVTELGYFSMPSRFCRDYWSPVSPDSCRLRDCACTQTCCSSAPTSAKLWGWYRPGPKRIGKLCNLYQVGNGHLQQKVILFDCLRMCLYLEPRFVWQKIYWRGCGLFICQQPSWKTIDVL